MSDIKTVVQHLNDSVTGLEECTKLSSSSELKAFLVKLSTQRAEFSEQLKATVNDNAVDDTKGSVAGSLHHAYIQLKAMITTSTPEDIRKEILRGDKILIESYNTAIQNETHDTLKTLLSKQLHAIHQDLVAVVHKI